MTIAWNGERKVTAENKSWWKLGEQGEVLARLVHGFTAGDTVSYMCFREIGFKEGCSDLI